MFKLAVLFAVVAVAVAKPSVYSPLAYDSVAVNAVPSLYNTPSVYNVAPVARVAPVAQYAPVAAVAPVAPVVATSSYRYVQNYYDQPGYVGVPFQPQVYSGAVPYFTGSPYHALLKRSSDEKKN